MKHSHDHAGVIAPPPLLYFGGIALGLILNWLVPWHPFHPLFVVGFVLIAIGAAIAGWAARTMHTFATPVNPALPVTHLVRVGPYRWSRNPIYLAMTLVSVGVAFVANTGWIVVALVPILIVMHYGVICREEQYLRQTFGTEYHQYQQSTRRWL